MARLSFSQQMILLIPENITLHSNGAQITLHIEWLTDYMIR